MKKSELVIIKLGGSVVTYKESLVAKARKDNIKRLAKEVESLVEQGYRVVLVHGAGSFGHPLAQKYQLHKGMRTEEQKFGYGQTTQSMLKLNFLITEALLGVGVRCVTLPPHSFVKQSSGKFKGFDYGLVKDFIEHGFVPVLFGDGVLDDKWGCSILSGDVIVSYLAQKLHAKKVVFLSDVDGIFDSDPKVNPTAKRISEITNENLQKVLKNFQISRKTNSRSNVTGEMEGKILAIKDNLSKVAVWITDGFKKGQLNKAVLGEPVGTRIKFI